jgi:hypothetical protein
MTGETEPLKVEQRAREKLRSEPIVTHVPMRVFERDGRAIFSKVDDAGVDLTLANCEFVAIRTSDYYRSPNHMPEAALPPSDAVRDLEALVAVCEAEFTSELTETDGDPESGQWRDEDEEAVSHGLAEDGHTVVPGNITFGHIRRARAALHRLSATSEEPQP